MRILFIYTWAFQEARQRSSRKCQRPRVKACTELIYAVLQLRNAVAHPSYLLLFCSSFRMVLSIIRANVLLAGNLCFEAPDYRCNASTWATRPVTAYPFAGCEKARA